MFLIDAENMKATTAAHHQPQHEDEFGFVTDLKLHSHGKVNATASYPASDQRRTASTLSIRLIFSDPENMCGIENVELWKGSINGHRQVGARL